LAVERALDELKSQDWILKWAAMSELARWKVKEAATPIRSILSGRGHPWVRGRALVALAELLGEQMLNDARSYTKHKRPELRAAAVEALGIIGSRSGEQPIVERLRDDAPTVRYQAVVALARLRRGGAWATIAPYLEDKDPSMVRHAIRALVYIDTEPARKKMSALLEHEDKQVRREAATALGKVLPREAIPILLNRMARDSDALVRVVCQNALASFDPALLAKPLLSALRSEDAGLYLSAMKLLALRPGPAVAEEVASLIREPDKRYDGVLATALSLLARVDPDRYRVLFARSLTHERRDVRVKAVESLASCTKPDHFRLLRDALTDREHSVRAAAFKAIRKATKGTPSEGIVAYLAKALNQKDRWTLRAAMELLRDRLTPSELPKAMAALDRFLAGSNREDRTLAAKTLEQASDKEGRRRIAKAQGYIADWMLIGPFPNVQGRQGYTASYFPEHEVEFTKKYAGQRFGHGASFRVTNASCDGDTKKSLYMEPPHEGGISGRTVATFTLELPARGDLKLTMFLGLQDGASKGDGVRFEAHVNKKKLLEKEILKPEGWQAAEVDLSGHAGEKVALALVLDPLKNTTDDRAVIGEPRIIAGDETVADLIELAPTAATAVVIPGKRGQMAWAQWHVNQADGFLPLHDIFDFPTYHKLAYGVADLTSPEEGKVRLWVDSDDGFVLWLNGSKISERKHRGQQKIDAKLRKGRNRLLIKVCNDVDAWQYRIRVTGKEGRRVDVLRIGK